MTSRLLPHSINTTEMSAVKQLKAVHHSCARAPDAFCLKLDVAAASCEREPDSTSAEIQNEHWFCANHRVDDDPILRYTTSARPGGTDGENGDSELAKKNGLQIDSVVVEEVAEFVLRLVVGRLCDSELLFHALKSDVGACLTRGTRLDRMEQLRRDKEYASDPDVAAIVNLIEQSSLSQSSRARALRRRSQQPTCNDIRG
ncbi:hypothetical protein GQ600_6361 [Phytophthora cactorum]|nr:hypothetical protein GQ600_6361 [Phytophthora cactorum]